MSLAVNITEQILTVNVTDENVLVSVVASPEVLTVSFLDGDQGPEGIQGAKGDTGYDMATFDGTINFNRGDMVATASVIDPTITASKIIQVFFTDALDEVAVLGMRITERSRTAGVGFDVVGISPNGAFGTYSFRVITQGT